jgi:putative Mg2+ transporter-C (MgtC) family protein
MFPGMGELSWSEAVTMAVKLLVAYALALPIGWNREKARRQVGLRTFPLVSLASCSYMLLGLNAFAEHPEAQARVVEGLVSGMGFIGGGAILKTKKHIEGTSTAASIWSTGAIGGTTGYGLYELAIIISAFNLLTFIVLGRLARTIKAEQDQQLLLGAEAERAGRQ